MSDIAIRFDGLLLAAVIAGSTVLFAVILLATLGLAVARKAHGPHLIGLGKIAFGQVAIGLVCFFLLIVLMPFGPTSGADLVDWLTVPWMLFFGFGLFRLVRFHRRRETR